VGRAGHRGRGARRSGCRSRSVFTAIVGEVTTSTMTPVGAAHRGLGEV
jgi:hypothetical protein